MPRKKKPVATPAEEAKVVPIKPPEVVPEAPAMEAAPPEGEQQISLADLKMGYVVGMTPGGDFVFELIGQEKGLVELLGLHAHATRRVDRIYMDNQMTGDRLIHEVGKAIALVNQKVDKVVEVVAPSKPENALE